MKRLLILIVGLATAALPLARAAEGAPKFIEYQGSVLDNSGAPLAPTTPRLYKMEFRLWSAIEGGTLIWSEQQFVNVFKGQFTVRLGEGQAAVDAVTPQFAQNELASAFAAKDRFIGITVINPPAPNSEISPRLALLSAPYALVANQATAVIQQQGATSTVVVGAMAYSTQKSSGKASVALSLDKRVNLIDATGSGTTATLPSGGSLTELVVIKTDPTTQMVTVMAPGGGKINTDKTSIRLKVRGDSVTLQHIGDNDWWIVKDSRDSTQVGTIIAYAGGTPPSGYLPCDGRSYTHETYQDLYDVIQKTWGSSVDLAAPTFPPSVPGAGTESAGRFNVPNLNRRFLRGFNPGDSGADEDAGARFAMYFGGSNTVGSYQQDAIRKHFHTITDEGHDHNASIGATGASVPRGWSIAPDSGSTKKIEAFTGGGGGNSYTMSVATTLADSNAKITATLNVAEATLGSGTRTDTETRPDSAVVRYCIKY